MPVGFIEGAWVGFIEGAQVGFPEGAYVSPGTKLSSECKGENTQKGSIILKLFPKFYFAKNVSRPHGH